MEHLWIGRELKKGKSSRRTRFVHADVAKGFQYYVEAEDADVLVLTETKVSAIHK